MQNGQLQGQCWFNCVVMLITLPNRMDTALTLEYALWAQVPGLRDPIPLLPELWVNPRSHWNAPCVLTTCSSDPMLCGPAG